MVDSKIIKKDHRKIRLDRKKKTFEEVRLGRYGKDV